MPTAALQAFTNVLSHGVGIGIQQGLMMGQMLHTGSPNPVSSGGGAGGSGAAHAEHGEFFVPFINRNPCSSCLL